MSQANPADLRALLTQLIGAAGREGDPAMLDYPTGSSQVVNKTIQAMLADPAARAHELERMKLAAQIKAEQEMRAAKLGSRNSILEARLSKIADARKQASAMQVLGEEARLKNQAIIQQEVMRREQVNKLSEMAKVLIESGHPRIDAQMNSILSQIKSIEGEKSITADGIQQQIANNRSRMVDEIMKDVLPSVQEAGLVDEATIGKIRDGLDARIAAGVDRGTVRDMGLQELTKVGKQASESKQAQTERVDFLKKHGPGIGYNKAAAEFESIASLPREVQGAAAEQAVAGKGRFGKLGTAGGLGVGVLATLLATKLFGKSESQDQQAAANPDVELAKLVTLMQLRKKAGIGNPEQDDSRQLGNMAKMIGMLQTISQMNKFQNAQPPALASMV